MNWSPQQSQEFARLRQAEHLRAATRRYAPPRPDEPPVQSRAPRSAFARIFARLSPVS